MATPQSAQLTSKSDHPQNRPRFLYIILIIACILALLFFIGATIFWIGLVHDKLSDTFGAIFTALGTIFGFIALVLAIPPFFQYLQERRTVPSPTSPPAYSNNKNDQSQFPTQRPAPNPGSKYSTKAQSHSIKAVEQSSTPQLPLPLDQPSQPMSRSAVQAPVKASKGDGNLKQLTVQQRSKLVEKLLACPTMRERSSRNRVVQELRFADT